MASQRENSPVVFTVGHSNRTLEEFIDLLKEKGITLVVDVRLIPRSRHNPWFNRDELAKALEAAGIGYLHLPGLGGHRRPSPTSLNIAWRNQSFRGYADYMQLPEFKENLNLLLSLAGTERLALMCAEAVPWRCHRSLIADALVAKGIPVEDIISGTSVRPHTLPPWAKVVDEQVIYPEESTQER